MTILDQAYEYELYLNNLILRNGLEYIYPEIIEDTKKVILEYNDNLYFVIVNPSKVILNNKITNPSDDEILKMWK